MRKRFSARVRSPDVNIKNKGGITPLMSAVMNDNKEMAEVLISKGADVNF